MMQNLDTSPEADTTLLREAKALRAGVHLLCAMAAAKDTLAPRASSIDQSAGYLYNALCNLLTGPLEHAPAHLRAAAAARYEAGKCLEGLHRAHADACQLGE